MNRKSDHELHDEEKSQHQYSGSPRQSLVIRVGQVIVLLLLVSVTVILSSVWATRSLSGDAALINHSGALRMHAMRVSRAYAINNSDYLETEKQAFESRLRQIKTTMTELNYRDSTVGQAITQIDTEWKKLRNSQSLDPIIDFDEFVVLVDHMVFLLQQNSEIKLNRLYIILGGSLLFLLAIGLGLIWSMRKHVVWPVRRLVSAAYQIGKGDFSVRLNLDREDEIGLLAKTLNQMAIELNDSYRGLESRVREKTEELRITNRSLQELYSAAKQLSIADAEEGENTLCDRLTDALTVGQVTVHFYTEKEAVGDRQLPIEDESLVNILPFDIFSGENEQGVLLWSVPKKYVPESWQIELIEAFIDLFVVQYELDRRKHIEQRLIISEERAVIARELHDSLAQSLSYLKLNIAFIERLLQNGSDKEKVAKSFDDLKNAVNRAYIQLRELLTTFRLKMDQPGFEMAVRKSINEYAGKSGIDIQLRYEVKDKNLTAQQEVHLLQILREGLSNIHRHAQASEASVEIVENNSKLYLTIMDNGKGMPDAAAESPYGHFGLNIINERGKELGARLKLSSGTGTGTKIQLTLDLVSQSRTQSNRESRQ